MAFDCEDYPWGSRRVYLMVLISQAIGMSTFAPMHSAAIFQGATGYLFSSILVFGFIGIPLMYMEFIVGQFTARSCIDVWKIRACLSHVGYAQVFWQMTIVFYNHILTSFLVHYLLISFENPIPYYECGPWSTENCDIEKHNFTVNEGCIKKKMPFSYCDNLYQTYPEYEYWRYFMLGAREKSFFIAWRVCLASGIVCGVLYLSCFRRKASFKWFSYMFCLYPIIGYFAMMIGSMLQKGLVENFEDAMDSNFNSFKTNYKTSDIILHVLGTLNIGTGLAFYLGSSTSFRAPCYSNIVITVVVCTSFTVLTINVMAMMNCPYSFEYNITPGAFMSVQSSISFEKTPRLLNEFKHKAFYLILNFSCNAVLTFSTSAIFMICLLETFSTRFSIIHKYTGLITFVIAIVMFVITAPFFGQIGVYTIFDFRRIIDYITIFIGMLESLVFVVWYGLDKFSEDVHFMQGIQPKALMKLVWMTSSVLQGYVLGCEVYKMCVEPAKNLGETIGRWTLWVVIGLIVFVALLKLIVAACKKQFTNAIKLDPMWGPCSEVLLRSRAMFSAHAMTKEYMYRQYHLQAGIQARQRASNIRREWRDATAT